MLWLIFTSVIVVIIYRFLSRRHTYWSRQGVPQTNPLPIIGDSIGIILRTQSQAEFMDMVYKASSNSRYVGMYQFMFPALVIRDPELIKQIAVKDFEYFLDHLGFGSPKSEPMFGKNLLSLKGQVWREMRSTVSPSFTSSKMKYMFSLISQNGEQFVKHFLQQDKEVINVEMKDLMSRFANDVIANTVFGIECNSLKEPNNEFYLMGKEATSFTKIRKVFAFMGYLIVPKVFEFFNVKIFPEEMTNYFIRIVKENIESREKHGIVRPDMISILLEAKKNNWKHEEHTNLPDAGFATVEESEVGKNQKYRKAEITDEDITSQAFVFFFAGFDSVSTLMSFMAYELAVNPEIQEKLIREVDTTREKCKGKITYEALLLMKYMDLVVTETLRKWPPTIATERVCTKAYTIEPVSPNEKPVHLRVGDAIGIPTFPLHRDPQYYPEPERFDPERFSDENKYKLTPYTYLPFGAGPRACIGSRFALLEAKMLFFYILSNFEIIPTDKTPTSIKIDKKSIILTAEGGFYVGLKRRVF